MHAPGLGVLELQGPPLKMGPPEQEAVGQGCWGGLARVYVSGSRAFVIPAFLCLPGLLF